jgi:osmotically-inducible protein OsmY
MSPLRYRDDEGSTASTVTTVLVGALAGFAIGVLVSKRLGGWSGLRARLRTLAEGPAEATRHAAEVGEYYDDEYETDDEIEEGERDEELEDRVLEAFRNDPILCERAVDIGSLGAGIIELSGWVESEEEAQHAVTLAGGVPEVETVVNRITIGQREAQFEESARRVAEGDPALTEARWEGSRVGTGRRRQGTSAEPDRHADPAVPLEDRWLREEQALRNAADDIEGIAERRNRGGRKGRGGNRSTGSQNASSGVVSNDAKPVDETPQT